MPVDTLTGRSYPIGATVYPHGGRVWANIVISRTGKLEETSTARKADRWWC